MAPLTYEHFRISVNRKYYCYFPKISLNQYFDEKFNKNLILDVDFKIDFIDDVEFFPKTFLFMNQFCKICNNTNIRQQDLVRFICRCNCYPAFKAFNFSKKFVTKGQNLLRN